MSIEELQNSPHDQRPLKVEQEQRFANYGRGFERAKQLFEAGLFPDALEELTQTSEELWNEEVSEEDALVEEWRRMCDNILELSNQIEPRMG